MTDFARVRDLFDIVIPPYEADEGALRDYFVAMAWSGATDRSGGITGWAHVPFILLVASIIIILGPWIAGVT